jgi:hypothetical protein
MAAQGRSDPIHPSVHFADEVAHERHGQSKAVKRFQSVYAPELVGGGVAFTDYDMIAGKR